MNNLFEIGLKIILSLSFIFFLVFTYVSYIWMNRKPIKLSNILAAAMVSILHTFKIVVISVVLLGVVSFVIKALPSF